MVLEIILYIIWNHIDAFFQLMSIKKNLDFENYN